VRDLHALIESMEPLTTLEARSFICALSSSEKSAADRAEGKTVFVIHFPTQPSTTSRRAR
jgi:hypothetical protein